MNNYRSYLINLVGLEWAVWEKLKDKDGGRYVHTSLGHEFCAFIFTKVFDILNTNWCLYYRSHSWLLGLGFSKKQIISEICNGPEAILKGSGGTMNLMLHSNIIDCNSIIGAQLPISVGSAIYSKHINKYTICVLGDGATNTGVFYESLNVASLYNLPIIFVVEDNGLAITENYKNTSTVDIAQKFKLFSIETFEIDDTFDVCRLEKITKQDLAPKAFIVSCARVGNHAISMGNLDENFINRYNFTVKERIEVMQVYNNCSDYIDSISQDLD